MSVSKNGLRASLSQVDTHRLALLERDAFHHALSVLASGRYGKLAANFSKTILSANKAIGRKELLARPAYTSKTERIN